MPAESDLQIRRSGHLDLAACAPLAEELGAHLSLPGARIHLDLDDCPSVGLGPLQVIVAAMHEARARGAGLSVSAPAGGAVAAALDRAGFTAADETPVITDETWRGLAPLD
ncbi:STAS domain-containing protein [Rhodovulum sp. DZ06]|uniref:STAS domain-containing protein n=1 Tax=Rhodovulum sp. DZ06 TaxID=3425126 RepID=UPI003D32F035